MQVIEAHEKEIVREEQAMEEASNKRMEMPPQNARTALSFHPKKIEALSDDIIEREREREKIFHTK